MKHSLSRVFHLLFLTLLLTAAGCVPEASQADEFQEGKHFVTIANPITPQVDAGKIEVTELFWYACPHCYTLEPTIEKFRANKPEHIEFEQVPATLSPRWRFHAKLFYVAQLLDPNGEKGLHLKIFEAIQKQRRKISNEDAMQRFFTGLGFSEAEVKNAYNSMEMNALLARADEVGAKSGADSVPSIIVHGKYRTSPSMAGSEEKLLKVISYLAQRAANEAAQ